MTQLRFIRIEFGSGVTPEDYDNFSNTVMDLAEAVMAKYPSDCDNEIFVSGGGEVPVIPEQPYGPGAFCDECGHFASRHNTDGCSGITKPCPCQAMQWRGYKWPRPWLPAPEGLRSE